MRKIDPEKRKREVMLEAVRQAGLSGLSTGGLIASGSRFFSGVRSPAALLKAGLIGGGTAGLLGAGGTYMGSKMLGNPEDDEINPYTRRGGIGGLVSGALAGSGIGALLASGVLRKISPATIGALRAGPANNLVGDALVKLAKNPSTNKTLLGSALGGTTGAALAGYIGADEGATIDVINNEMREIERRRRIAREHQPWT